MSLLSDLNFFTTVLTFGCVSFAASNFGIKLGKLTSFKNTSGYEYVSESSKSDALYDDIAKVAKTETNAPEWAKEKGKLKDWCGKNQNSIRNWKYTSKYCLIRNNVRHQLIKDGYTIKGESDTSDSSTNTECKDILEMYADNTQSSLGYLLGKSKCFNPPAQAAAA